MPEPLFKRNSKLSGVEAQSTVRLILGNRDNLGTVLWFNFLRTIGYRMRVARSIVEN